MDNMNEIKYRIKKVIIKTLNTKLTPEDIKDDAYFYQDLGIDSVDLIDLVVNLEEEFKIKFHNVQMKELFENVNSVAQVVIKYLEN